MATLIGDLFYSLAPPPRVFGESGMILLILLPGSELVGSLLLHATRFWTRARSPLVLSGIQMAFHLHSPTIRGDHPLVHREDGAAASS